MNNLMNFANPYRFLQKLTLCLLIFSMHSYCFAQEIISDEVEEDFASWIGVDTDYELFDNFSVSLANQIRFYNNLADFKSYFFELGGDYKLDDVINSSRKKKGLEKTKNSVRLGASYRYVFRDVYSQNSQRVSGVLTYKPFIEALEDLLDVSFRVKYQHDFTWNRQSSRTLLRGKLAVKCPFKWKVRNPQTGKKKKLDLSLLTAAELFYQFHYTGNVPYRLRVQAGIYFELPNFLIEGENTRSLTIKYVGQRSLSSSTPEADHIIALLYGFSF